MVILAVVWVAIILFFDVRSVIRQDGFHLPLWKLPFWFKLWWAKRMLYMFRGFGETYNNDIVLYTRIQAMNEELELWIRTEGRPSTSNPNYHINSHS